MKLAQTRLVTTDVPGLAHFYQEVTGLVPIGSEDYVEFRGGGTSLAISSKRSIDLFNGAAAEPAANQSVILDFEVDDVDAQRSRLRGTVETFVQEPTNQPWGNRSMLFRDPDGNLVYFLGPIGNTEASRIATTARDQSLTGTKGR